MALIPIRTRYSREPINSDTICDTKQSTMSFKPGKLRGPSAPPPQRARSTEREQAVALAEELKESQRLQKELKELRARNAKVEAERAAARAETQALRHELQRQLGEARDDSEEDAPGGSDEEADDAPAAPARSTSSALRVTLADHPLSQHDVKDYALSACKGPFGVASWWRKMQRIIDEAQEIASLQTPPFPPALALMAIKSFFTLATANTGLQPWLEEPVRDTSRLRSFASWANLKEATQRKLMTPALCRDMHTAFHALELKGNGLGDFLNSINTYLSVSGLSAEAQHILKVDKLTICLSVATLAELERRHPGKSLLSCSAADLDGLIETLHSLVAEAEASGTKIARTTPSAGSQRRHIAHVAAQHTNEEGKIANASIAALAPGGSCNPAQTRDNKRGGGRRPFPSTEEIASRIIADHIKLHGKADVATVAQRIRDRACRVCGDKVHHTNECHHKEFVASN